ncbi:MAG: pre-mRNA splicing factor component-domain-containing protein [Monoraphidium minutum]|nr:MAG: pre-mRNA splicing factor component-domain-containing protein [Monoraphidium minutum]
MRIQIKGGIWKNTEDEILKAAVMKYGLNQWARISSLLVRKSAKQCKARWYEWLDPAIKKTEWTREEDEKLLHLAKLLPTQWRTIAPIVGRTPAQCLERYEKLLDMAVGKDDRYDPADDPRRLRPGEIDPNPESKPAKPDAVDMGEDEKEMLAEARARLANTRGKKAKRKAREKALEEARRLASLQKKRELKAAGIEAGPLRKKGKGIDYNAEVAFEKKPAPGFYDTGAEAEATKSMRSEFRPVTLEEMEGKRRQDIEDGLVKRDLKRQKLTEAHDTPAAVARMNALHETAVLARRGKMMLPAPQVSEAELEMIARMGEGGPDAGMAEGAGGEATRQLLGQYATPARFATPMRTPRNQTTRGALPKAAVAATPNPLAGLATPMGGVGATPGRGGGGSIAGVGPTPMSIAGVAATPGPRRRRRPGRDAADPGPAGAERARRRRARGGRRARAAKAHARGVRSELRAGLAGLPAPQNEYAVAAPELPEQEDDEPAMEEDAADTKARRAREAEARRAAEEAAKPAALRRGLPRPLDLGGLPAPPPPGEVAAMSYREKAGAALASELSALLEHDARAYPLPRDERGGKRDKKRGGGPAAAEGPPLARYDAEELGAAAGLVAAEVEFVRQAMGHGGVSQEEYSDAWAAAARDAVWLPASKRYGRAAAAAPAERADSLRAEFDALRGQMEREAHRAAKLEKKAGVVIAGLQQRDAKQRSLVDELAQALADARGGARVLLRAAGARAGAPRPTRAAAGRALVAAQREREAELQARYRELGARRDELLEALRGGARAAAAAAAAGG